MFIGEITILVVRSHDLVAVQIAIDVQCAEAS